MSLSWDAASVQVTLPAQEGSSVRTQSLSHDAIAAMSNYEALPFGLPEHMEAVLTIAFEGRVDMPGFRITRMLEPFNHMHPWLNYTRIGALLFVGEHMLRLNLQQLRCFDAMDAIAHAGADVAERLRAWPALMDAVNMPGRNHVLVLSTIPMVRLSMVEQLPATAMTRAGKLLKRVSDTPHAAWAMEAGRRYYLRS